MEKYDNNNTKALIKAIFTLKNEDEISRFFRDLLTPQEIIEFGKRWQAAQMLNKNMPYTQIVEATGLSSTTVARVSRWLKKVWGYRMVIKRLGNKNHHNHNFLLTKRSG